MTRLGTAWGTGVGHTLIESGEQELRTLGHEEAILCVLDDNPRARRFYELATGPWTASPARSVCSEVRYAKRL